MVPLIPHHFPVMSHGQSGYFHQNPGTLGLVAVIIPPYMVISTGLDPSPCLQFRGAKSMAALFSLYLTQVDVRGQTRDATRITRKQATTVFFPHFPGYSIFRRTKIEMFHNMSRKKR